MNKPTPRLRLINKKIKLGIIGMSPGNGHPYSWSAIFNGYNPSYMKDCPFPVIPEYLSKQNLPKECINGTTVTHIWTQNKKQSEHIAKSTYIENVVDNYEDLIGKVDAILLARDDYKTHFKIAKPFIKYGYPIYIDKPITIKTEEAKKIFHLQKRENQIFTCSALSFANELQLKKKDALNLGKIKYINANIMKDWNKYSIHIIEPVLKLLLSNNILSIKSKITNKQITTYDNIKSVSFTWDTGLITIFSTLGEIKTPIKIELFGTDQYKELKFEDTFNAFKNALTKFINIINKKETPYTKEFVLKTISIIEEGNKDD